MRKNQEDSTTKSGTSSSGTEGRNTSTSTGRSKKVCQMNMTVKKAIEYLHKRGVSWSEVYLRMKISRGELKSHLWFNSRILTKKELDRAIREVKTREEKS